MVVNENGEPVLGAVVSVTGAQQGEQIWGGQVRNVDRLSITGVDGVFLITATVPHDKLRLKVSARRLCEHHSELLETDQHHTIKMQKGVFVSGRVISDGKPITNHVVGIYPDQMQQFDGRLFTRSRKTATDENGRFQFVGVRPEVVWNIYSMMSNGEEPGLIETEEFKTGTHGQIKELGDFEIQKVHTVRGHVKLVGGGELPEGFRVYLSREYAWDYTNELLGKAGRFEFQVPINEVVEVSFRADGYRLSRTKNKLQIKDDVSFEACLDKPIEEYEIWLEKKSDF